MKEDYFKAPNRIFDVEYLSEHAKMVFLYLTRCYNNSNFAFPSFETIAKKCSISKSTAFRAVKELENNGFVTKKKRGFGESNLYVPSLNINSVTETTKECHTDNSDGVTVTTYKELYIKNQDINDSFSNSKEEELTYEPFMEW